MKIIIPLKSILLGCFILCLMAACKQEKKTSNQKDKRSRTEIVHDTVHLDSMGIQGEQLLMPVLYQQRSGEYRGLCYQAFQLAKLLLINDLKDDKVISKRCVVLDIDETVLDNSPLEAKLILEKLNYTDVWDDWCKRSSAQPLAGAAEFLNFARRYGVEVFYVTNRSESLREVTADNIRKVGLPLKGDEFLLMKGEDNSKEARRNLIEEHYHIALLMGDNLNDFSRVFERRSADDRIKATDSLKSQFGSRFVLLPNSIYGDWDQALSNYKSGLSAKEKLQIRYNSLKPY